MNRPKFFTNHMSDYLCRLRDSGTINMYASGESLGRKFGLAKSEQKEAVLYWMSAPSRTETVGDEFPVVDWQYEVANEDTRLGYDDWVAHRQEAKNDDAETIGAFFC